MLERQNLPKTNFFLAGQIFTYYEQKFSNMRPLLSITFSQGFWKSKRFGRWTLRIGSKKMFKQSEQMKMIRKFFFCSTAILHPFWANVSKSEITSNYYFSPRILKILKVWTLNFGMWGKKTVKRSEKHRYQKNPTKKTFKQYLKTEQTDKQTHTHTYGQIDIDKVLAQRTDALKKRILLCCVTLRLGASASSLHGLASLKLSDPETFLKSVNSPCWLLMTYIWFCAVEQFNAFVVFLKVNTFLVSLAVFLQSWEKKQVAQVLKTYLKKNCFAKYVCLSAGFGSGFWIWRLKILHTGHTESLDMCG